MSSENGYNMDEVAGKLDQLLGLVANLHNDIESETGISKGDEDMPKRMREKVVVNDKTCWLNGYSVKELCESYVQVLIREGVLEKVEADEAIPLFGDYLKTFYETFKVGQESNTKVNRARVVKNHILPQFGQRRIDRITTTELQKWLNDLGNRYSHETLLKIRNTMNPVFDAAVEDEILSRNPLRSRRIEIGGKDTVPHQAIPKAKMELIKAALPGMEPGRVRNMLVLLCYSGMRFEEILGLKWSDIDGEWIYIQRAVVHPDRNKPEIKEPKTKTSKRTIPYFKEIKDILEQDRKRGFILSKNGDGKEPLSYTEARRAFDKIRKIFNIPDYTAHDFRDTCATEWREAGIPLDVIARMLGHSKTETTEKKYVKYRTDILLPAVAKLDSLKLKGSEAILE